MTPRIRTVQPAHKGKMITRSAAAKLFRALKQGRKVEVRIEEDGKRVVLLSPKNTG